MALNQFILAEFDREMESTRKTLARIPDEVFGWKPHEKSGTMGWLASHVANLPMWASVTMTTESLDLQAPLQPGQTRPKEAKSKDELLQMFSENVTKARAAIAGASDSDMMVPWELINDGKSLFKQPRIALLRGFVMNHLIHHRGQLTVYMRLKNIPLPALYGPSADENPWG